VARIVASGPTLTAAITATVVAVLLITAILFARHGSRIEP
jgi:hypothetical protein